MKLSRKLIPAFIMLLVSAVLMSTASFAWFSVNTTATASDMHITVASATNIMISNAADGTYKSSEEFPQTIANLVPASAVAKASPEFFYMEVAGDNMSAESAAFGDGSEFKAATANQQYLTITTYLKVVGEELVGNIVPNISVTRYDTESETNVAVTKDDSPVYPALRVLFVVGDQAYLYAPVAGADANCLPIASLDGKTAKPTDAKATYLTNNSSPIVTGVVAEQVYTVQVYIWLEGQDACCKAANAINLEQLDFSIGFNYISTKTGT